jgi:RimJ/RimL family protein N-acetyltransferase
VRPLGRDEADWYAASLDHEILRWSREEPITNIEEWWKWAGKDRLVIECCDQPVGAAKLAVDDHRVEISYWVAADHRGNGYATSGLEELTSLALDRHPKLPIELEIHPENDASTRVATKVGYAFVELRSSCDSCADADGNVAVYRYTT